MMFFVFMFLFHSLTICEMDKAHSSLFSFSGSGNREKLNLLPKCT